MNYGALLDFLFAAGTEVGEFLHDEEKDAFIPMTLEEIVKSYVDNRNLLAAVLLRREIKIYLRKNMTPEGLQYQDPPFGQDTSFPEDYFDGDLEMILTNVSTLLDKEIRIRTKKLFSFGR